MHNSNCTETRRFVLDSNSLISYWNLDITDSLNQQNEWNSPWFLAQTGCHRFDGSEPGSLQVISPEEAGSVRHSPSLKDFLSSGYFQDWYDLFLPVEQAEWRTFRFLWENKPQTSMFSFENLFIFASKPPGWYKHVCFTTTKPHRKWQRMYRYWSASRRRTFRPQQSRKQRFSQELVCRPSGDEQNKLTCWCRLSEEAQHLRHSKVSKPKCSKTQRALARHPAQLRYGLSRLTLLFTRLGHRQSWKRPRCLRKVILCCFTLHSAKIHKVLEDMWGSK